MERRFDKLDAKLNRVIELETQILGLLLSEDKASKLVLTLGKPEPQGE